MMRLPRQHIVRTTSRENWSILNVKPDNLTIDLIYQAGTWPKAAKMESLTNNVLAVTIETVGKGFKFFFA